MATRTYGASVHVSLIKSQSNYDNDIYPMYVYAAPIRVYVEESDAISMGMHIYLCTRAAPSLGRNQAVK